MIAVKEPNSTGAKVERRDVPICPTHDTTMLAYMTRGRITYYACRCKACRERGKSITRIISL